MLQFCMDFINHWIKIGFKLWHKYRSFIIYCMIGATGAILDSATFFALTHYLHFETFIANPISATVGITNNFFLNAFFNFKTTDKLHHRYVKFFAVGVIGIIVGTAYIYLLHDIFGLNLVAVKLSSIVIVAILQYGLNKRFSFSSSKK